MHDSLYTEEGGSEADDERTSDRGGGGAVDELDDDLAHLNDLDVTQGFDLDTFLQERARQAPSAGDDDGTAQTMDSSQGGAVDASSVPAGRAESALSAASTFGTDLGNGEVSPRGPVREGSARAERLVTALRDSAGTDPGSETTPGGVNNLLNNSK